MRQRNRTILAILGVFALASIASGTFLMQREMTVAAAQAEGAAPAGGALSGRIASAMNSARGPLWLRYETDSEKPSGGMCGGRDGGYDLDRQGGWTSDGGEQKNAASSRIAVFLRAENQKVTRIQVFDTRCPVTASGSEIRDLGTASADEGVVYLSGLMPAASRESEKLAKNIVFAVALHGTQRADDVLYGWASGSLSTKIRRDAAFWMGSARGERSFDRLVQLSRGSGDAGFRKHVVFAISLNRGERGTSELLRLAKEGQETEVRRAAIFWLSQRASKAAVDGLEAIVENESDAKLREHAVFALSQLPEEEGVPKLIQLARTHRDPGVRKKAIFWLSQKNDPRVLNFLEDVLTSASRN